MNQNIPVLLCFDIEPYEKYASVGESWNGFPQTVDLLSCFRARLENASGAAVHFSWFVRMDPQVATLHGNASWPVKKYLHQFNALRAAGDEIGLHVHSWRLDGGGWYSDFQNEEWILHCIESSYETYREVFGSLPYAFRFGDRWIDDNTMNLVDSLGFQCDMTIEPGMVGFPVEAEKESLMRGKKPNYRNLPSRPYHPNRFDCHRAGTGQDALRLWEIPISTAPLEDTEYGKQGNTWYETMYLAHRADIVCAYINSVVSSTTLKHIALLARTDIGYPGFGRQNLETILEYFFNHPERKRFRFITANQMVSGLV